MLAGEGVREECGEGFAVLEAGKAGGAVRRWR